MFTTDKTYHAQTICLHEPAVCDILRALGGPLLAWGTQSNHLVCLLLVPALCSAHETAATDSSYALSRCHIIEKSVVRTCRNK